MTACGRPTSARSGWAASTQRATGSWTTSAEELPAREGITKESVTHQLITKCYPSPELFTHRCRPAPSLSKLLHEIVDRVKATADGLSYGSDRLPKRTEPSLASCAEVSPDFGILPPARDAEAWRNVYSDGVEHGATGGVGCGVPQTAAGADHVECLPSLLLVAGLTWPLAALGSISRAGPLAA